MDFKSSISLLLLAAIFSVVTLVSKGMFGLVKIVFALKETVLYCVRLDVQGCILHEFDFSVSRKENLRDVSRAAARVGVVFQKY